MLEKMIKKLNYLLICFLIIILPITYYINNIIKIIRINFYEILWLLIPIQIFIYCYNLKKRKNKIDIFDITIYILIILGMISTNLAIDLTTSVWGAYLRNEGFLSILSYYLLFLNCKNVTTKEEIKKILNLYFIIGIIQFVFCVLQVFVRGIFSIEVLDTINYMAMGFHGNPNFLGSHIVILLSLAMTMYLLEKKTKKYLFLSVIFFSNLILAESTGPFLSIIFTLIFLIVFLCVKKRILWKKIITLIISLFITFIMTIHISEKIFKEVYQDTLHNNYTIKGDLESTFQIITGQEQNETIIKRYGSGRLILWENSLKLVPKYLFFGTGIDNFGYAYAMYNFSNSYCDKAHNEYLQILVTQGIFAIITYLFLLALIFFKGIKCNENLTLVLFISFIGYSVQAFLNISVVTVAPFYFIIMGLLVNQIEQEKTKKLQEM